ncbi:MAG: PEP-CTERM sorting domain-containing protein [Planctomycetota bacterium]
MPLNLGIYNGFFDSNKYSNASSTLGKPVGNSPSIPVSTNSTPTLGTQTQETQSASQLALVSWTPTVNGPYVNIPIQWTQPTAFNGTSPNTSGQYSLVIWTEETGNYQIKNDGQLMIGGVPGISYSSTTPGVIDGTSGSIVTTAAASMAIAPVPEPTTWVLAGLACVFLACITRSRRTGARRLEGRIC